MATSSIGSARLASERRFYTGMALAILCTVLLGFGETFFFKPLFPEASAPPESIFMIHGIAFSLWIALLVTQTWLVARGSVNVHRTLGVAGGVLAIAMVILGVMGALTAAIRPSGFMNVPLPGLQFLAIPLFDMIIFPAFIIVAFIKRHNPQSHKRWMILGTIEIITAAIARWPIVSGWGPLGYFGVTDLFVVALAVWDFRSSGKLHPATLWGGLILIISQPLRLVISGTDAWMSFAQWATGLIS